MRLSPFSKCYLSVKKVCSNEAEERFALAQKMAQLHYKTYVRRRRRIGRSERRAKLACAMPGQRKGRMKFNINHHQSDITPLTIISGNEFE